MWIKLLKQQEWGWIREYPLDSAILLVDGSPINDDESDMYHSVHVAFHPSIKHVNSNKSADGWQPISPGSYEVIDQTKFAIARFARLPGGPTKFYERFFKERIPFPVEPTEFDYIWHQGTNSHTFTPSYLHILRELKIRPPRHLTKMKFITGVENAGATENSC